MSDVTNIELEEILESALSEKAQLLEMYPKLTSLQNEIDKQIGRSNNLNEKFKGIVLASEQYNIGRGLYAEYNHAKYRQDKS